MDSGGEDSGLDGVVEALVEGAEIDWKQVHDNVAEHDSRAQGLELLDQVGRAFRDAGEEAGTQPLPFQWGPLQVVEMLGEGSFGEVFRAHDLVLDREVALKLRHRDDDASRNRGYVEEARCLARVRHPNVVIVHGAEVYDGRAGLWAELIDGDTLERVLERQGPMGAREALAIGLDLCRALAAVHAAGLLHGDVKLANVMREVGGRTVLMDFGAGRELLRPTRDASAFGTPVITAPEVLNGETPTVAADLYSLGTLLFRALTGTHRIEAETLSELLRKHEAGDCRGLRDQRPDLAYETVRAVERALERVPEDRYASAGAMERGLAGALDQELSRVPDATARGGAHAGAESGVAAPARRRRVVPGEPDFQPFVGRLGELTALDEALRQARAGTPRPIVIRGIAGVGKTELTRTFLERAAASGATTLYARYLDYEGSRLAPFETLLRLLRSALGVESATELVAAARDRCGVRLPAELLSEPAVDLSTPVVSARTEVTAGDRFRGAVPIAECFRALARDRPLVLALDDLQWSDAATLDVVGYLMRSLEEEALLLLLVARQENTGDDRAPLAAWLRRHAGYRAFTSLELHPFGEREIHAALEAIFPGLVSTRDIPPHQLAELSRLTGGNPYFLNEICRLLAAHRRVVFDTESSGGWKWKGWGDLALPATLVLAASARLDRLPEEVRGLLDPAAVIGDEFRVETLAVTSDLERDPDAIEGLLQEAVRAGVLAHAASEGEDYRFDHPILHAVVYGDLPPQRRRKLHRQAARALETIYAGALNRFASALSAHWSAADEPAPTLEWSLEAWLAARGRWQWPEAVACLERADAAARSLEARGEPLPAARKYRLALGLAEGYASVGRLKESETKVAACVALAEELADTAAEGAAWLQGARTAGALGRYADAVRQAERARDLFTETGDRDGQALARLQLATIYAATGEYEQVRRIAEEIAKLVPADSETAAVAAGVAGWSLALQGRYAEGLPLLERAREHHERAGNVRQRALLLNRLQWVHRSRGQYEEAVTMARLAREEFRKVEDANFEAKANMALGQSRLAQGLVEEGRAHLERTLAGLAEIGDAHCEAEARWLLGRALGEQGDYDAATRSLARALEMIAEIGDRDDEFRFLIDRARVERRAGRVEDALRSARAAREIAEELDNAEGAACSRVETAGAALAAGDTDTALAEAQAAVELLDELGSGELWRALHALGRARAARVDVSPDPAALEAALEPLRRAVALVSAIREQIPLQDAHRRALAAEGLAAPARDLHRLLVQAGLEAEAREIAASWPIA